MTRVSDDRALWLARHILPHEPALRAWLKHKRVVGLDIDDIVQETYARLAAAETVAYVRNPKTYMFQTAHSIILTHLRRSRVVSIRAVEDVELYAGPSEDASPERQLSDREELHRIAQAIGALPDRARAVFTLRRVEGLSQREVSERLNLSESTVEKHMGKALRLMMDWLGHGGISQGGASKGRGTPLNASEKHGKTRDE
jgi:RNA polymerase sigma-70 factor (ECF subfamily)